MSLPRHSGVLDEPLRKGGWPRAHGRSCTRRRVGCAEIARRGWRSQQMALWPSLRPHAELQRHPRHRVERRPRPRIAVGSAVRVTAAAALHVQCWPCKKCRQGGGCLPIVDDPTWGWEVRVRTHSSTRTRQRYTDCSL